MIAGKLSEKAPVKLKNRLFETFPVCAGCVSLLLSHPGWGPATAGLKTKAIAESSRALDKKTRPEKLSPKQTNFSAF